MKKEKAITLISLVITIIILIILAGVAINLSLGNNGIFKRAKQARNLYSNAQIAETSQINEIEKELENIELDLPSIPYKGLGYKFIYDGTLGEVGLEGKNMCNEVTGGWTSNRVPYSFNGVSGYYRGYISTNNKINLSEYSKLIISANIFDVNEEAHNCIYGKREQFPSNDDLFQIEVDEFKYPVDVEYPNIGKNINLINVPKDFNNYIIIDSNHSTSNDYYFDYTNSYMRNYTDSDRYIDVYSIVALKEDSWQTWAKLAKVDVESEENNSLEKILNNNSTLEAIFNNEMANKYLLKCTGTLMVEILKNDNSYNNIPITLLQQMKENDSWNHFLKVCERI